MGNGNKCVESFADHFPTVTQELRFILLRQHAMVSQLLLRDLFQFVLNTFEEEEVLWAGKARHFWNLS